MSRRDKVTPHHVVTVHNAMFNPMDVVVRVFASKKTQWKGELYFTRKFAWQKQSKYYAEVPPTTGILLLTALIVDHFRKLRSFRKWHQGMDIVPEDDTAHTTRYPEAFLKYVENEYCTKHRRFPMIKPESIPSNNLFPPPMASRSHQSSYDPYDLSSNNEEYLKPKDDAETTRRWSDLRSMLIDSHKALFEFTTWISTGLGANELESSWLPPRHHGD